MADYEIAVNGKSVTIQEEEDTPLLWVLRDTLGLTGTKYGCGLGQCGVCTVHLDGNPIRSCITPLSSIKGKSVTTIEGLSENNSHRLQRGWIEHQVPQCGYCQSGQIMQAVALLQQKAQPTRAEIASHMNAVLCRCGTYTRIVRAIEDASKTQ